MALMLTADKPIKSQRSINFVKFPTNPKERFIL